MTDPRLLLWIRAEGVGTRAEVLERARRRGFHRFVDAEGARGEGEEWWRADAHAFRADRVGEPAEIPRRRVSDPAGFEKVRAELRAGRRLAVEWEGERILPVETLVGDRPGRAPLWVVAASPEEAVGLLGALEHGPEAVVVEIRASAEIDRLEELIDRPFAIAEGWERFPLSRREPAGMGDRVLVDTTSLLGPEEGLLVGSSAALLFLVLSEAVGSRYTRPRPFRVNAGAAHSYVLLANGETRYLSELASGEAVLAVQREGPARAVRVGRLKIERRPLVRLEVTDGPDRRTL
ncbi:MAG: 3-dehydroquinate synthase II, partial [Thermoplasmata archaeon]